MLATQSFTIGSSATTFFGCGSLSHLARAISGLCETQAILVTDSGVVDAGIAGDVQDVLGAANIDFVVFDGVHPNPSTRTLDLGAEIARAAGRGAVIALGGGSVLDAAKGIALMAVNEGAARDFDYRNQPRNPGLPIVAIPTTAGTGSETNAFGVIDDLDTERKFYVGHASVAPRVVILDPLLTRRLPPGPTAAAGMDVLVHALESLSSIGNNPFSEGINLQVVSMVRRFLPQAVADGQTIEARAQMLLASHMAGLAFAATGLGMGHAVVHALSARVGAAHGVALSVLLPFVLEFNAPTRMEIYARVASAMGVGNAAQDDRTNADAAIDAVRRLTREIGMPVRLRDLGCTDAHIAPIVDDALGDEVMANTPRVPTRDELLAVLRAAL